MVPVIDARYGIYVRNAAGDWVFNMKLFEAYLEREGLLANWPRLESGQLNMNRKIFETMSKGAPQLEELRQLRHTRNKMRKIKLAVGAMAATVQSSGHFSPRLRARNRRRRSGSSDAFALIDNLALAVKLLAALTELRQSKPKS